MCDTCALGVGMRMWAMLLIEMKTNQTQKKNKNNKKIFQIEKFELRIFQFCLLFRRIYLFDKHALPMHSCVFATTNNEILAELAPHQNSIETASRTSVESAQCNLSLNQPQKPSN